MGASFVAGSSRVPSGHYVAGIYQTGEVYARSVSSSTRPFIPLTVT